ncbi:hypothetical protein KJ780_03710, partial [Candidatus Micrarchaeota archaeon]|nr:hypothetical protein [Candidatus Micrarchaeota archaeon]
MFDSKQYCKIYFTLLFLALLINHTEAASVTLDSPSDNSLVDLKTELTSFYWFVNGFTNSAACTLSISGSNKITAVNPNCANNAKCRVDVTTNQLTTGEYDWNVSCTNVIATASSGVWSFQAFTQGEDATCEILSPQTGEVFPAPPNNVFYTWKTGNLDFPYNCNIFVDSYFIISTTSNNDEDSTTSTVPMGLHAMKMNCFDPDTSVDCGQRLFNVDGEIILDLPADGITLNSMSNTFSFRTRGFSLQPSCNLSIYNTTGLYTKISSFSHLSNPNYEDDFSKTISDLPEGDYTWSVYCARDENSVSSLTNHFTIDYPVPLITLTNPDGSAPVQSTPYTFRIDYNSYTGPTCGISIYAVPSNNLIYYNSKSCWGGKGEFSVPNLLEGNYKWNASCSQGVYPKSSAGPVNFLVDYNDPNLVLTDPAEGFTITTTSYFFRLGYGVYSSPTCAISIYNKSNSLAYTGSKSCGAGSCSFFLSNALPEAEYKWNASCSQGVYPQSSAGFGNFSVDYPNPTLTQTAPLEGVELNQSSNYFTLSYSGYTSPSCSIFIYTDSHSLQTTSTKFCAGNTCTFTISNLPEGNYSWNASCSQNLFQNISTELKNFSVKYPIPTLVQSNPNDGVDLTLITNYFNLTYTGYTSPACEILITNAGTGFSQKYSLSCSGGNCFRGISNLPAALGYSWFGNCSQSMLLPTTTGSRSFNVRYDNTACDLLSPANNSVQSLLSILFQSNFSGFAANPSCTLHIYPVAGGVPTHTGMSCNIADNTCSKSVLNLGSGFYLWNVTCTRAPQADAKSKTFTFEVRYADTECHLIHPSEGYVINTTTNVLYANFSGFLSPPSARYDIYDFSSGSKITSNSLICSGLTGNCTGTMPLLAEGNYTWNITCTKAPQNPASSEIVRFEVDYPDSNLTLVYPAPADIVSSLINIFNISYNLYSSPMCAISIYNSSLSQAFYWRQACPAGTCPFIVSNLPEDIYTWNASCSQGILPTDSTSAGTFAVKYPETSVNLTSPTNSSIVSQFPSVFNITYQNFSIPFCVMEVYASGSFYNSYPMNCLFGNCTVSLIDLPPGLDYSWNASCSQGVLPPASSESWDFLVVYPTPNCTLIYPNNDQILDNAAGVQFNVSFPGYFIDFSRSVPNNFCNISVYNKSGLVLERQMASCSKGECLDPLSTMNLENGTYSWNASCNLWPLGEAVSETQVFHLGSQVILREPADNS